MWIRMCSFERRIHVVEALIVGWRVGAWIAFKMCSNVHLWTYNTCRLRWFLNNAQDMCTAQTSRHIHFILVVYDMHSHSDMQQMSHIVSIVNVCHVLCIIIAILRSCIIALLACTYYLTIYAAISRHKADEPKCENPAWRCIIVGKGYNSNV